LQDLTPVQYLVADAQALLFRDGQADAAVAFMSLMDVDDMAVAASELARVLEPGGRAVLAMVHLREIRDPSHVRRSRYPLLLRLRALRPR
jgi:ubiquinone/menaquinone biosynthesis C-methylase UbiE